MAIAYFNLLHSEASPNLPKLGFLVWKVAIWQPWLHNSSNGVCSKSSHLQPPQTRRVMLLSTITELDEVEWVPEGLFTRKRIQVPSYFVQVQNAQRQNVEVQIVDMKMYNNLLMYPDLTNLRRAPKHCEGTVRIGSKKSGQGPKNQDRVQKIRIGSKKSG
jgi:hypothetical protein